MITTILIIIAIGVSILIADRVHFHAKRLRYKKNKIKEDTDRRFDYLLVQLYWCEEWQHIEAFHGIMERILTDEDRKDVRYNDLIVEVEKMDAALTNDFIRLQRVRTKQWDNILKSVKL